MKRKKMIVKVQTSLFSSGAPEVLVYDETRFHMYQGELTKEIHKVMKGQPKKYFYAMVPMDRPGKIMLMEEAPWQEW